MIGVDDPGKRTLMYLLTMSGNILTYSSSQRDVEIRMTEYLKEIEKFKMSNEIVVNIEERLSLFNKNSCNFNKFEKYVDSKLSSYVLLIDHYTNKMFRKFRWFKYINKNRSEKKLVEKIFDMFRMELPENERQSITYKDITLVIGDWGRGPQMKNFRPTPMIGLKRLLAKYFNVILIDEYNTSKLSMIVEKDKVRWVKNKNVYVTDRPKKTEEQQIKKLDKAKKK